MSQTRKFLYVFLGCVALMVISVIVGMVVQHQPPDATANEIGPQNDAQWMIKNETPLRDNHGLKHYVLTLVNTETGCEYVVYDDKAPVPNYIQPNHIAGCKRNP